MSGKNRSQKVILTIVKGRNRLLPAGDYSFYIDQVYIERGSVNVKGRIIDALVREEDNSDEPSTT